MAVLTLTPGWFNWLPLLRGLVPDHAPFFTLGHRQSDLVADGMASEFAGDHRLQNVGQHTGSQAGGVGIDDNEDTLRYIIRMFPGFLLAALMFLTLRPWRVRRLAEKGLSPCCSR